MKLGTIEIHSMDDGVIYCTADKNVMVAGYVVNDYVQYKAELDYYTFHRYLPHSSSPSHKDEGGTVDLEVALGWLIGSNSMQKIYENKE